MMLRKALLLIIILILPLRSAFAQSMPQDEPKEDGADLAVLRYLIMEEVLDKMAARRQEAMEEAMNQLSAAKEKRRFLFAPGRRSITQRLKAMINNKGGAKRFFFIQNTGNALSLQFESEDEKRKIASSALPTKRSRLLFEELLRSDFSGSVYHPNLAAFDISLESGLEQSREKFQPNLTGKLKNSYLNRFHAASYFLRKKPYAFSLSADRSREIENREFFERQVINSTRYSGIFGLKNEFIPAGLSIYRDAKNIDRASRASQDFEDEGIALNLSNESKVTGQTQFDAAQNKFSRAESGTPDQKGISRDFGLLNQKFLSGDEKRLLNSSLHFFELTGTRKSQVFNLNENLNIEHNDYLESSYNYNFSDRSSGEVENTDNRVGASLRHRLYESLASSFSPYYLKSNSNATSQDTYGLSLNEDYTKKLGKIGRLSLGTGLAYSQEKRESEDAIISIIDESHTLTTGTVTLLNRSGVDTQTVVVTNSAGTTTFTLNVDYQLISAGANTQIQRIATGSIASGEQVLVDYQARASPLLKFSTLSSDFRFRMDFLENLIGIFYRINKERHPKVSEQEDFILQTLTDTAYGFDFNYKNLSVELENEDFSSNLSPYERVRLRESIFFNPTEKSTLTFESSQIIVRLINTQDTQRFFDYISRYSISLNRYSRFNLEAGYRKQQGTGIDLDDVAAGANYELNFGKLMLNARYDFKRQLFLNDRLINHFSSVKIKREF